METQLKKRGQNLTLMTLDQRSLSVAQCTEGSGPVVEGLTQNRIAVGSSLTGVTALCPWARHINPWIVLVLHRNAHPNITEKSLTGM